MKQIVLRFLVGGFVVSTFAIVGDLLKPKSFAGLFGAAPSVALATIGIVVVTDGAPFAKIEGRSMIAGAVGFFLYASFVSWVMMRYQVKALAATTYSLPLWFVATFGFWYLWLN